MNLEYSIINATSPALKENLGEFGFRILFPFGLARELVNTTLDLKVRSELKRTGDRLVKERLGSSFHKNLSYYGFARRPVPSDIDPGIDSFTTNWSCLLRDLSFPDRQIVFSLPYNFYDLFDGNPNYLMYRSRVNNLTKDESDVLKELFNEYILSLPC